jgi:hypothetical protein
MNYDVLVFGAGPLSPQWGRNAKEVMSVFDRVHSILGIFSSGAVGFSRHSGSRASLS